MEKKQVMSLNSNSIKKLIIDNNSVIILAILLLYGIFGVNKFATTFSSVVVQVSLYGLIAVGLSLVMITGNIDLSVGYQAGLSAVITIMVLNATGNLVVAIMAALLVGAVCGALNGYIVTNIGVSPLIATIATNYIYKGLTYSKTSTGSFAPSDSGLKTSLKSIYNFQVVDGSKFMTLTVLIVAIILVLLLFVLRKTRYGNSLYITGDNAEAGEFAGIHTKKVALIAYILCGLLCALAGVFMASRSGAAQYTQGSGMDVFAVSVCVIGGIKMTGGKGTMFHVLVGLFIMRIITNILNLNLIPATYMDLSSGILLIVVLIVDRITNRKAT
jgi:ribose/xylose/arabinose/galactoside ABC-type transport system permease subunit